LEIEPLEEVKTVDEDVPAYENIGDINFSPFDDEITVEQNYEPSSLSNILTAGADGLQSPTEWAQIGAAFGPPGAEELLNKANFLYLKYNMSCSLSICRSKFW